MQLGFCNFLIFNYVILTRPMEAEGSSLFYFFSKNVPFSLSNEQEVNKLSTFFD